LQLDALALAELAELQAAKARAHLTACAPCCERLAVIERDRAHYRASRATANPLVLPRSSALHAPAAFARLRRKVAPRRPLFWRRFPVLRVAGAALGLAALVLLVRVQPWPFGSQTTRTKGSSHLEFFVRHRGAVRKGAAGEIVAPGDALRFAYFTNRPRHLAVLSLDPRGHASVYYPQEKRTIAIDAGQGALLPASTVVDESLGRERIWGMFCPRPVALEPIRAALEASRGRSGIPPECELDSTWLEKRSVP
jgi:hypothetical protein